MKINRIHLSCLLVFIFFILCFVGCGSTGGGTQDATASIELSLSGDSNTINADGSSSISITAYIINSAGEPVAMNTGVIFESSLGTFKSGTNKYSVSTIDDNGIVTVSLISSTMPGIAEVTCSSSGVTQSIKIYFIHDDNSGLPVGEEFSLALEYHNISGLWIAGLEDTISAYLGDYYGNAVQDGVQVSFKTYNTGGFFEEDVAATGGVTSDNLLYSAGVAASTLISSDEPSPMQGFVSVTAETDGGETTAITSIAVTPDENHILYAGTNGGGVYKSTDKGSTWETISRSSLNARAGQNWLNPYIKGHSSIAIDPDDHNTVYVGTGYLGQGTLFRSLDGGMNWNSNNVEQWNGIYSSNVAFLSLLCDDGGSDYVWLGTEGEGILYATDGVNFQPAGGTVTKPKLTDISVGDGTMSTPSLNYNSKSETWTATCFVPEAAASPIPTLEASDSGTNGWMSDLTVSSTTKDETWVVQYVAQAQNITAPTGKGTAININSKKSENETWTLKCIYTEVVSGSTSDSSPVSVLESDSGANGKMSDLTVSSEAKNEIWTVQYVAQAQNITTPTSKGTIININPKKSVNEVWTLKCIYADLDDPPLTGGSSTLFSVTGSISGSQDHAQINADYSSDYIDFKIIPGQTPFIVGDEITFEVKTHWTITGSSLGAQDKTATTGISYVSDNNEVGFTISQGTEPFAVGDYFIISSSSISSNLAEDSSTLFSVAGSISGIQDNAQINSDYSSDYIDFKIIHGLVPFAVGDVITFEVEAQWTVIGSSSGVQDNTATTGMPYVSDNNEIGFTIFQGTIPFTVGDYFTLYTIGPNATYWIVKGSLSGTQNGIAQNNMLYTSDGEEVSFVIYEGTTSFATGDQFSFQVTSSTLGYGWTVWDIVKQPGQNRENAILYAATNVGVMKSTNGGKTWNEPSSFTGDFITCIDLIQTSNGNNILYVGTQNAGVWSSLDGGVSWTSYSSGIGQGTSIKDIVADPINNQIYAIAYYGTSGAASGKIFMNNLNSDRSISSSSWVEISQGLSGAPLYAMAVDNIDNPLTIFAGGEGINFYKTSSDFNSQTSSWQENNSGLTNTIMARAPVLFSGECSMEISRVWYENILFLTVYIQDRNGNPPIAGSTFKAEYHSETDGDFVFTDIVYPDAYTYQGTFRDPNNPYTNYPYRYSQAGSTGDYITLTYTPACYTAEDEEDSKAGCSGGGEETRTIYF